MTAQPTHHGDPATEARGFAIRAPHGATIEIPHEVDDRTDPYRALVGPAQVRAYYDAEGYVVVRGAVPPELCDEARSAFLREVKPYGGYIYRQATAVPEKHVFTEHGHMLNSILNIHDLDRRAFPRFREAGVRILTHEGVQRIARALLWAARTIHGSLPTQGDRSRSSFTGHCVRSSTRLLQFQTRPRRMRIRPEHGVPVHHPKDQNLPWNRVLLDFETTFPSAFKLTKKPAIKVVTR